MNLLHDAGKTGMLVGEIAASHDKPTVHYLGFIAVADKVRAEAPAIIARLRELGVKRIVMLTGDGARVAGAVAQTMRRRRGPRRSPAAGQGARHPEAEGSRAAPRWSATA